MRVPPLRRAGASARGDDPGSVSVDAVVRTDLRARSSRGGVFPGPGAVLGDWRLRSVSVGEVFGVLPGSLQLCLPCTPILRACPPPAHDIGASPRRGGGRPAFSQASSAARSTRRRRRCQSSALEELPPPSPVSDRRRPSDTCDRDGTRSHQSRPLQPSPHPFRATVLDALPHRAAHGTAATITPWSGQVTRGESASMNTRIVPASTRHRHPPTRLTPLIPPSPTPPPSSSVLRPLLSIGSASRTDRSAGSVCRVCDWRSSVVQLCCASCSRNPPTHIGGDIGSTSSVSNSSLVRTR